MTNPKDIIREAIDKFSPIRVLLLFSGGHDSLCSTHVSASILNEINIPFEVYHGNTTIGIKETRQYVIDTCELFGWRLVIREPPREKDRYESLVLNHGFPGPTKKSHQIMYRCLKERALRAYVTHEVKSSPFARENVLLISGVRKHESIIRMGYTWTVKKEYSRVWCNPIFFWHKKDCENYMKENKLPRNRVKDVLGISGECLCGCFSDSGEYDKLVQHYPEAAEEIDRLDDLTTNAGFPWGWSSGPTEWNKQQQSDKATMNMCIRCKK
jgi:3'-phosphoadenosine 5'-phosphosulfate sulfotransferase (PAPS reductase)/FAD synthetase